MKIIQNLNIKRNNSDFLKCEKREKIISDMLIQYMKNSEDYSISKFDIENISLTENKLRENNRM